MSIPQYAGNMEQLVDYLCEKFDPMLNQYQLANSTDWKSVVSFPVDLRGKELFQLEPSRIYKEPRNLFQKLLFYLGMRNFETSKEIMLNSCLHKSVSISSLLQNPSEKSCQTLFSQWPHFSLVSP